MELYIEPKRPDRNLLTGRFLKGNKPHNKGKKWDEFLSKESQEKILNALKRHRGRGGCFPNSPVVGIASNGTWCRYPSIKKASEATGIGHSNISNVCRKRGKTAGGYRWFYEESNEWINLVKWGNV